MANHNFHELDRSKVQGRCETGDGKPARFEGFGHKFCWDCYSDWVETYKARQTNLVFENPQMSLNLVISAI